MNHACGLIHIEFHIIDKPHQLAGEFRIEISVALSNNLSSGEPLNHRFKLSDRLGSGRLAGKGLDLVDCICTLAANAVRRIGAGSQLAVLYP